MAMVGLVGGGRCHPLHIDLVGALVSVEVEFLLLRGECLDLIALSS